MFVALSPFREIKKKKMSKGGKLIVFSAPSDLENNDRDIY
jgi:hypothetical protein